MIVSSDSSNNYPTPWHRYADNYNRAKQYGFQPITTLHANLKAAFDQAAEYKYQSIQVSILCIDYNQLNQDNCAQDSILAAYHLDKGLFETNPARKETVGFSYSPTPVSNNRTTPSFTRGVDSKTQTPPDIYEFKSNLIHFIEQLKNDLAQLNRYRKNYIGYLLGISATGYAAKNRLSQQLSNHLNLLMPLNNGPALKDRYLLIMQDLFVYKNEIDANRQNSPDSRYFNQLEIFLRNHDQFLQYFNSPSPVNGCSAIHINHALRQQ